MNVKAVDVESSEFTVRFPFSASSFVLPLSVLSAEFSVVMGFAAKWDHNHATAFRSQRFEIARHEAQNNINLEEQQSSNLFKGLIFWHAHSLHFVLALFKRLSENIIGSPQMWVWPQLVFGGSPSLPPL